MRRFIVIVLDGFGIGAMKDVGEKRPEDIRSNTCRHILEKIDGLYLPNLEKLGLMNALGEEIGRMKFSKDANFGKSDLMHFGADTFYGHQEIMGTDPKLPKKAPFRDYLDVVEERLKEKNYKVERVTREGNQILLVNDYVTIGDNIETDPGQAYNVTSALDHISFREVTEIAKVVRKEVEVSRVITFGGNNVTKENLIGSIESKDNHYIGVNAPKSGVYESGYQCIHLGYGINPDVQAPTILGKAGHKVVLIGKVQDIVFNDYGTSIPGVDTETVLKETLHQMNEMKEGFICTNVQETDLSGHAENAERYAEKLSIADGYIGKIIEELHGEDILIVMADHGNDPTVGHSRHTREMVPMLIYKENLKNAEIGHRQTLSDIGATVLDYFGEEKPENGTSFLNKL
ncbi:phosphopentomutase [Proteiniclasticum sp.]|uniref:phosphopentomutase n=1 Tax=Proteiniclasticum sp. TaxID=2053595 RepID=UPI002897D82C|nr:phosphopentomutase [Proteiniclasticum sp.]